MSQILPIHTYLLRVGWHCSRFWEAALHSTHIALPFLGRHDLEEIESDLEIRSRKQYEYPGRHMGACLTCQPPPTHTYLAVALSSHRSVSGGPQGIFHQLSLDKLPDTLSRDSTTNEAEHLSALHLKLAKEGTHADAHSAPQTPKKQPKKQITPAHQTHRATASRNIRFKLKQTQKGICRRNGALQGISCRLCRGCGPTSEPRRRGGGGGGKTDSDSAPRRLFLSKADS